MFREKDGFPVPHGEFVVKDGRFGTVRQVIEIDRQEGVLRNRPEIERLPEHQLGSSGRHTGNLEELRN